MSKSVVRLTAGSRQVKGGHFVGDKTWLIEASKTIDERFVVGDLICPFEGSDLFDVESVAFFVESNEFDVILRDANYANANEQSDFDSEREELETAGWKIDRSISPEEMRYINECQVAKAVNTANEATVAAIEVRHRRQNNSATPY